MNYKLQVHFLNDVTTWRAHIPALITMDIINLLSFINVDFIPMVMASR